ncbi:ethanolamine ammonia-lyase subunit EutC [Ectobacillus ponti]|uniref:Ethanolamine ammonia-lyase small subunit n=1 Tax=Ectobacillus ponti TaxID=2961894 RepID=A0AA41XCK7_9BACI|nr:ethanolamine ammonia-lyase subunit EutC [Ectobacillus ponti]MCP8970403.1 ethanolamine ammonia-lyase subunit EutC [Ectobacillus ponti]
MKTELVSAITAEVLRQLQEPPQADMVRIWEHDRPSPPLAQPDTREAEALPKPAHHASVADGKTILSDMLSSTPARIAVGRSGYRPKTDAWLQFRLDHAAAVDAVYSEVSRELLERLELFTVRTRVTDKETYILRPDLGRLLQEEDAALLRTRCRNRPQVQIIASDGLSAAAVESNLEDVYLAFRQSLAHLGLQSGTPFFIHRGRVAVMDQVGDLLEPEVVVYFIGERPGLVSAESLSAYLCYRPRKGTIEADRMVVSNIHAGGIPPVEAGAYLGTVVQRILLQQASGVHLTK